MILHTNKKLFRDAVNMTAQQMNLPAIYIEKDYWVTFALKSIFSKKNWSRHYFQRWNFFS
jgi:hypothetical protein